MSFPRAIRHSGIRHSSFRSRLLLWPLLTLGAAAEPLPKDFTPPPAVLEAQAADEGRKVWNTRFFRLDSDMPLRAAELARLSQVADSTATVLRSYPLPLFAPPAQRSRISIYKEGEDYVNAGGFHGTAGFYFARRGVVLLRGDFFVEGADKGMPPHYHEDIMAHEVVHLCMHKVNRKLPQWLVEGIAEYFSCAHLGGGRYSFSDIDNSLRNHLRSRLSPNDPGIPLEPVAGIATLDGHEWLEHVTAIANEDRYQAYATALLLAHYYLHGGEERLATLRTALAAEKPADLIAPADGPKIQQSMSKYWKSRGLTLEFKAGK